MMNNNDDAPGDAKPSGDEPGESAAPVKSPRENGQVSNDTPHVVYDPLPTSRADIARQQRALRRAYHNRAAPSWVKKISWILFPVYGIMRMHDPNYEEHLEQWQAGQHRNYDEGHRP